MRDAAPLAMTRLAMRPLKMLMETAQITAACVLDMTAEM